MFFWIVIQNFTIVFWISDFFNIKSNFHLQNLGVKWSFCNFTS